MPAAPRAPFSAIIRGPQLPTFSAPVTLSLPSESVSSPPSTTSDRPFHLSPCVLPVWDAVGCLRALRLLLCYLIAPWFGGTDSVPSSPFHSESLHLSRYPSACLTPLTVALFFSCSPSFPNSFCVSLHLPLSPFSCDILLEMHQTNTEVAGFQVTNSTAPRILPHPLPAAPSSTSRREAIVSAGVEWKGLGVCALL